MNIKYLKISLTEDFPAIRLIIAAMVITFAAVVTIYKYVDLSDSVSASFSSTETTILALSDMINRVFIFLPLYIFVVSGARLANGLGNTGILLQKSRAGVATNGILKVFFYTVLFAVILLIIVTATSQAAFPKADDFTRAFFGTSSAYGFRSDVLSETPSKVAVTLVTTMFLTYFTIGIINFFLSILLKEDAAFVLTVIIGIGAEAMIVQRSSALPLLPVVIVIAVIFILLSFAVLSRKNL
ncbi:MAG: hypothetical protein LBM41_07120 [Ruminococcus sp.]|nr:hypothetical protein [Ruminococcus sp.]